MLLKIFFPLLRFSLPPPPPFFSPSLPLGSFPPSPIFLPPSLPASFSPSRAPSLPPSLLPPSPGDPPASVGTPFPPLRPGDPPASLGTPSPLAGPAPPDSPRTKDRLSDLEKLSVTVDRLSELVTISMAAAGAPAVAARAFKISIYSHETRSPLSFTCNLRSQTRPSSKHPSFSRSAPEPFLLTTAPRAAVTPSSPSQTTFHGPCYVLGDNIDTDQIIPVEHLTLVPSTPDKYRKLVSLALCGLPSAAYRVPFVPSGAASTPFMVVIAGANFGCGSSREHAPVALGAAGVRAVVAEYYAQIFFRNFISTGEMFPLESEETGI